MRATKVRSSASRAKSVGRPASSDYSKFTASFSKTPNRRERGRGRRRSRKPTPAAVAAFATMQNNPKRGLSSWASNVLWSSSRSKHSHDHNQDPSMTTRDHRFLRGKSMPAPSERSLTRHTLGLQHPVNARHTSYRTTASSYSSTNIYYILSGSENSEVPSVYSSMSFLADRSLASIVVRKRWNRNRGRNYAARGHSLSENGLRHLREAHVGRAKRVNPPRKQAEIITASKSIRTL